MKKFNIFKIVQMSLLILITLISVYLLMQPEVKQYIFHQLPQRYCSSLSGSYYLQVMYFF